MKEFHFFCSSATNWTTGESLRDTMARQEANDLCSTYMQPKGYRVFKVLLPNDAKYGINHYRPELPAEQLIEIDLVLYEEYGKQGKIRVARGKNAVES
jgi:hypothetical protein